MGRTVLITGGAKGIGRAAAELFAAQGDCVIINYQTSETKAEALVKSLLDNGFQADMFQADVACEEQVRAMFEFIKARFGAVDILINNAGIAEQKLFTDITLDAWNRMMNVHVTGAFNCCKCALPEMIRKKSGKIINVSSIWGITGASCEVHYSTAKAALIGFTKALAKEVGPSNIQVNCVAPGIISTDMNKHLNSDDETALCEETPLGRFGTPAEIAKAIQFLASDAADFITGQVLSPNGGFVI